MQHRNTNNFVTMIDVHVLVSDRPYIKECLESLKSEHIKIHLIDVDNENYGKARARGFSSGNFPYVASIDDDDIVVPEVFDRAIRILKTGNHTAYYSNHHVMDVDGKVYGQWFNQPAPNIGFSQCLQMHHVVVYRREIIEPVLKYLDGVKTQERRLLNLASIYSGKVFGDTFKGLYWRVHDGGLHKKYSVHDNPKEWHDIVKSYEKKLCPP